MGVWEPWCLKSLSDSIKVGLDGCNGVPRDLGTGSQVYQGNKDTWVSSRVA